MHNKTYRVRSSELKFGLFENNNNPCFVVIVFTVKSTESLLKLSF